EALVEEFSAKFFDLRQRKGVTRTSSVQLMYNPNYFAAMMLKTGRADALISGVVESYGSSAKPLLEIIGVDGSKRLAGIYMVMMKQKQYFFADCTINVQPDAETLAEI